MEGLIFFTACVIVGLWTRRLIMEPKVYWHNYLKEDMDFLLSKLKDKEEIIINLTAEIRALQSELMEAGTTNFS